MIAYLDYLLLFAPEQLVQDLQVAQSILENLGWLLNLKKIQLDPIPESHLLRLRNGLNPVEGLSPSRKNPKGGQCDGSSQTSIRQAMSALGLLTAGLHFRPLQRFILGVWDHSQRSLNLPVQVPGWVKRSLWWLRKTVNLSYGLE